MEREISLTLFLPNYTCTQKVFEISYFCTIQHSVRDVTLIPLQVDKFCRVGDAAGGQVLSRG